MRLPVSAMAAEGVALFTIASPSRGIAENTIRRVQGNTPFDWPPVPISEAQALPGHQKRARRNNHK
jgi:hypothetical protein